MSKPLKYEQAVKKWSCRPTCVDYELQERFMKETDGRLL